MSEAAVKGGGLDLAAAEKALASSSTSERIAQLQQLQDSVAQKSLQQQLLPDVLELLFGTHALYHDRESRIAVQKCLVTAVDARPSSAALEALVKALRQESQKPGIAVSNAFVLVEWCSVLMQCLAGSPTWQDLGGDLLLADADALEKCLQPGTKSGVVRSATVVTRRAFRKLLSPAQSREKSLDMAVTVLTAKRPQPVAKHALILGVIAGVCARQPALKSQLETLKPKYYDFYSRELIGSRTPLPEHVALGLADFFSHFVTLDEAERELIPAIEKGLLRAPEVVLQGVLKPFVTSLPDGVDLSKILQGKLLKPLLANVKSSNVSIHTGAVAVFKAIAARCSDFQAMDAVAGEIANLLAAGKLATPDQRVLHAEMLEATPLSEDGASKVSSALVTVASKEGNEVALAAETSALTRLTVMILEAGREVPKPVLDAVTKGLAEKKPGSRRLWMLFAGNVLHSLGHTETAPGLSSFVESVIPKFLANFEEVVSNAAGAAQSGLVIGSYILTALSPTLRRRCAGSGAAASLVKAAIPAKALSLAAKQAFLLNHRIFNKISGEDDLLWFCRALSSVSSELNGTTDKEVAVAWSHAMIYLITAGNIPPKAQREATKSMSTLYAQNPTLMKKKPDWNE
ncbi:hypothetical protein CDD83_734 [Cordyceps sp. RAO-2017]|nr:hypothetical protein CDD83_734 [Cordyceps sp. RAO-2017]